MASQELEGLEGPCRCGLVRGQFVPWAALAPEPPDHVQVTALCCAPEDLGCKVRALPRPRRILEPLQNMKVSSAR